MRGDLLGVLQRAAVLQAVISGRWSVISGEETPTNGCKGTQPSASGRHRNGLARLSRDDKCVVEMSFP
jgi:hypothetical protein